MKSHIQMPKVILKNFEDERHFIYALNCKENSIRREHARTLYTQEGYYSNDTEQFLNEIIESKLSSLVSEIDNNNNQTSNVIEISDSYIDYSFKYLYSLLSRSPFLYRINNEDFSGIINHNNVTKSFLEQLIEDHPLQNCLKCSMCINSTDYPLVLPTRGYVRLSRFYICPMTPKGAILFYSGVDNVSKIITDIQTIRNINYESYKQEQADENNYVVSNQRNALIDILDTLNY